MNGARAVVGVVGKGHLRGVCYALTHDAGAESVRGGREEGRGGRNGGRAEREALSARPSSRPCCSPAILGGALTSGRSGCAPDARAERLCYHCPPPPHPPHPLSAAGAQLRFSDLVGGKNVKADRARARAAAAGRFALETVVVGAAWAAWTALQQ